ncbi:hypothetical protein N7456_000720 [Penicillium angulare]|uniref:Cell surface spherulin 4-like protein n=1 Tax=Penicillium angulare TaxID=116970 RepID=A0A9W9KR69_9EURO|nr:hypothetical protein N7456_000720 [Penicillium angulare]
MGYQSNIIVPLYVYPSLGAWSPLEEVVSAYSNIQFTIIINPGNGPGSSILPDANYTRAIVILSSYDNVRLIGYVHTSYAKRNISMICRDIETYAAWPVKSANPDLAVRGIFFDETPQQYDANSFAYLQGLSEFVRGPRGLGSDSYIVHNPGTVPDPRYLPTADSTVVFEETYSTFQDRYGAGLFTENPDTSNARRAVLIHSVPVSVTGSKLQDLIKAVRKVANDIFITHLDTDYYASFGPKWADFVDLMDGKLR